MDKTRDSEDETLPKLLIKITEAARLLSMSERKLWSLTKDGTIQCIKIGRSKFYCPKMLAAWVDQKFNDGGLAA
jgi:predicted DNA-binding transcriptional regulator AlpA